LSEPSTLEAQAARIDAFGQPLLAGLNVSSDAPRLALLGDWSPVFRLLAGEAELSAGVLKVCGVSATEGVQQGALGLQRLDPSLPNAWSTEQFLGISAELSGLAPAVARRAVQATVERLGLGSLTGRRLGHLRLAETRALLVAHARLTDPKALCLEQPLLGLDTSAEQLLLAVIERAADGRRLLVSLADPEHSAGERELARRSDACIRLQAGVAVVENPAAARVVRVTATVCRNHEAFAAALAARGLSALPTHEAGLLNSLTSVGTGPAWRYLVELTDGSTAGILDAALETEAGLIELNP